jgi:superfamily I DNA/RNA helicase
VSRTTLFGPPGSGKTTTLSKWARQAAKKHGGENIMVCSLTKTAATEIQSRNTDVPKENVGTLHAHCYRAVTEEYGGKYKVISDRDVKEFNEGKHSIFKLPMQRTMTDDVVAPAGETMISQCDLHRSRMIPMDRWNSRQRQFWGLYQSWKGINKLIDFTDMIEMAYEHIDCPLDYIILDEAQDSSALEYALLEKWASQAEGVVIAGDDDQAAYEWRGASVDSFLNFSEDHRVLPRTYRLPKRVKEYADRWIHQVSNRKEKSYDSTAEIGQVTELDTRDPAHIAEIVSSLSGSTMILTTCGYMLRPFIRELQNLNTPYHNPYRRVGEYSSEWNPLIEGTSSSVTVADSVRSFIKPPWSYETAYHWIRDVSASHLRHGTKALLKRERSNESLVPLDVMSSWLGESGLMSALNGDIGWWISTIKDPKKREAIRMRWNLIKNSGDKKPQVIVGTIHSVKGGQADNVVLMPDLSSAGKTAYLNAPDPVIRQMYIGMTRAKDKLFLALPSERSVLTWT